MNFQNKPGPIASTIAVLMALGGSGAANAAASYGNIADPPGVYFGTGNVNGNWTIDTTSGIELALRAKNQLGSTPALQTTIDGSSDVYHAVQGLSPGSAVKAKWNWEFSINVEDPGIGHLSDYFFRLGVDTDAGAGVSYFYFNPVTTFSDNAFWRTSGEIDAPPTPPLNTVYGMQNSENIGFSGGNVFTSGTYDFVLQTCSDAACSSVLSQTHMQVQVGQVPEPATLGILGLGLLGIGWGRRKKA